MGLIQIVVHWLPPQHMLGILAPRRRAGLLRAQQNVDLVAATALYLRGPACPRLAIDSRGLSSATAARSALHVLSSSASATPSSVRDSVCKRAETAQTTTRLAWSGMRSVWRPPCVVPAIPTRGHSTEPGWKAEGPAVTIHFVLSTGETKTVTGHVGQHILAIAHDNDIDLEGACEASLACSTCHVIIDDEDQYDLFPEPCEEEDDMLDLAFGLEELSRLGCQIVMTEACDGLTVRLPSATRNMAVDGFVPKPH